MSCVSNRLTFPPLSSRFSTHTHTPLLDYTHIGCVASFKLSERQEWWKSENWVSVVDEVPVLCVDKCWGTIKIMNLWVSQESIRSKSERIRSLISKWTVKWDEWLCEWPESKQTVTVNEWVWREWRRRRVMMMRWLYNYERVAGDETRPDLPGWLRGSAVSCRRMRGQACLPTLKPWEEKVIFSESPNHLLHHHQYLVSLIPSFTQLSHTSRLLLLLLLLSLLVWYNTYVEPDRA